MISQPRADMRTGSSRIFDEMNPIELEFLTFYGVPFVSFPVTSGKQAFIFLRSVP